MSEDDDREMRAKSEDNQRFAGNKKTPAPLHSKDANKRMNTGASGAKRGDEDVDLGGYDPSFPDGDDAASKQAEDSVMELLEPDDDEGDDLAEAVDDVDTIAEDLLQLEDEETARAIARVIVRTGDVVGELAASIEDDRARMNDRMESA